MKEIGSGRKCLLLFCGPPGCGKTSATLELATDFARKGVRPAIISYDDDTDPRIILDEGEWNDKSFKYNRDIHKELIDAKLRETDVDIVIVDDIMYLCSMRRELYVLARSHNAKLVCVQLSASLSTLLYRNSLRQGKARINEDAVVKIHNAFENVDTRRTAERYSIVVSTDGNKVSGKCGENCDRVESHGTYLSPTTISAIHNLYFTSIRYQQRLEKIYSKEALGGNHESRDNFHIHELDLFLREQVGIIMKSFKSIGFCKKKQEEVKTAKAEIMKGFISHVKCQHAELPRTEIEDALNEYKAAFKSKIIEICISK